MNTTNFNKLLTARIEDMKKSMASKSDEYSTAIDKLHNFKRAAQVGNTTPQRALVGMWLKHIVSVLDIVDRADNGQLPDKELWNEKIRDSINYLVLLEAIIKEQMTNAKK